MSSPFGPFSFHTKPETVTKPSQNENCAPRHRGRKVTGTNFEVFRLLRSAEALDRLEWLMNSNRIILHCTEEDLPLQGPAMKLCTQSWTRGCKLNRTSSHPKGQHVSNKSDGPKTQKRATRQQPQSHIIRNKRPLLRAELPGMMTELRNVCMEPGASGMLGLRIMGLGLI